MTNDDDHAGTTPIHASSPTDHVLTELQLYGWRPDQDEPDPRPLPEDDHAAAAVADIFDALIATLGDTRLEPDLEELLWGTVNLFHRATSRVERELDDNEQAQRRLQKEQDGSEVRSVELERVTAAGQVLIERRDSMELFRDLSAEAFEHHTGTAWRPRTGSMVKPLKPAPPTAAPASPTSRSPPRVPATRKAGSSGTRTATGSRTPNGTASPPSTASARPSRSIAGRA